MLAAEGHEAYALYTLPALPRRRGPAGGIASSTHAICLRSSYFLQGGTTLRSAKEIALEDQHYIVIETNSGSSTVNILRGQRRCE